MLSKSNINAISVAAIANFLDKNNADLDKMVDKIVKSLQDEDGDSPLSGSIEDGDSQKLKNRIWELIDGLYSRGYPYSDDIDRLLS